MPTRLVPPDDAFVDALLRGIAASAATLCLCDAGDRIRFANRRFRDAFMPQFDGEPIDTSGQMF